MSRTTAGAFTIVHHCRRQVAENHYQGVFLAVAGTHWVAGRMYDGARGTDGFSEEGEWWHGRHFTTGDATENMMDALKAYPELAMKADVWHRLFEQDAAESLCRFLAGPPRDDLPKLSAGWKQTEALSGIAPAGSTILMPFHEAKYHLFWFLIWTTRRNAMEHLTRGVTIDRHEAHQRVKDATGPIRFEFGYNTYWLADDEYRPGQ